MYNQPKLTLVGGGPGDPDLITLKGIKTLQNADVVLYDALINKAILNHAPRAIKKFVGKRKGYKKYTQDGINELIVKHAFTNGHVVRLKGGDPFVFGQGSEEIDYAESFGIPTEVVPGISSVGSVPATLGIPLTKRKVAQSFWVVTGTTAKRKLSTDVYLAAQSSATVVILMGMSKLPEIVSLFQGLGRGDTPVAIIQNGTLDAQQSGIGTINSIEAVAASKGLSSPAIIVIGDVVKSSAQLRSFYEDVLVDTSYESQNFIR